MTTKQIGAQTYTIREQCKTPADIAKSFKRLSDMGFGVIEAAALGPIEPSELKKILDDNGLVCASRHTSMDELSDASKAQDIYQALDCNLAPIGGFGFGGKSEVEWKNFIIEFNSAAGALADKGIRAGYHNHSHELAPFAENPAKINPEHCPYALLTKELHPSICFELDTYWIAHGGSNPQAWIEKIADSGHDRLPVVHVKDMTITPQREQKMCEVGSGNLDWPGILKAFKNTGTKYYIIERDNGELDPFESLKISLDNLLKMGLQ